MALNIAVPLSGVGGLSPISPIAMDSWENIKILVSPIGSESSGVSSLDSDDAKTQAQKPTAITPQKPVQVDPEIKEQQPIVVQRQYVDKKIIYNGRNILDLGNNIDPDKIHLWNLRYAYLPENNMPMFLKNRSQYHRLGANGLSPEYRLLTCPCCDFQYPINRSTGYFCQTSLNVSPTTPAAMTFSNAFNKNNNERSSTTTISTPISAVHQSRTFT